MRQAQEEGRLPVFTVRPSYSVFARRRRWRSFGTSRTEIAPNAIRAYTLALVLQPSRTKTAP